MRGVARVVDDLMLKTMMVNMAPLVALQATQPASAKLTADAQAMDSILISLRAWLACQGTRDSADVAGCGHQTIPSQEPGGPGGLLAIYRLCLVNPRRNSQFPAFVRCLLQAALRDRKQGLFPSPLIPSGAGAWQTTSALHMDA